MIQEFSEQELIRRESLAKLKELGIEPYPAAQFPVNANKEGGKLLWLVDKFAEEKRKRSQNRHEKTTFTSFDSWHSECWEIHFYQ